MQYTESERQQIAEEIADRLYRGGIRTHAGESLEIQWKPTIGMNRRGETYQPVSITVDADDVRRGEELATQWSK